MTTFLRAAGAAVLGCVGFVPAAGAHVTLETAEAPAGSTYKAVIRLPHGCGAEATRKLTVTIPEGVIAVKPMPKAGWTLETVSGAYGASYDYSGDTVTEGAKEISWTGELPDAWYDEFVFRAFLTTGLPAGETVYFPVVQTCASGQEAWVQIPAAGQDGHALEYPAPGLKITAAAAGEGHHHGAAAAPAQAAAPAAADHDGMVMAGALMLSGGFARATLPNAPVAGGFVTIANSGAAADRLLGGSADFASTVEMHQMSMEGGVMKMRRVAEGLEIPGGGEVALAPGGYHLMFSGLTRPLKQGETVNVTLEFANAGQVTVPLQVLSPGAKGPEAHKH